MNNNTAKDILDTLFESTKVNGFVETLHAVFGKNMKVSIPLSKSVCETPIEMLELGTRADNALTGVQLRLLRDGFAKND